LRKFKPNGLTDATLSCSMEDDIFDILGLSIFASGGKWCLLNNAPCIPLSSCDERMIDGRCQYESEEEPLN
jgi:hypothetical protein